MRDRPRTVAIRQRRHGCETPGASGERIRLAAPAEQGAVSCPGGCGPSTRGSAAIWADLAGAQRLGDVRSGRDNCARRQTGPRPPWWDLDSQGALTLVQTRPRLSRRTLVDPGWECERCGHVNPDDAEHCAGEKCGGSFCTFGASIAFRTLARIFLARSACTPMSASSTCSRPSTRMFVT